MTDVTRVVANAAPGNAQQVIPRNMAAGEAMALLQAVYVSAADTCKLADADLGEAESRAIGIVLASQTGETSVALGERVSVCLFGPVEGFSGATPGANAYVSTTAGGITETKPTGGAYQQAIGRFVNATCLFVNPVLADPASA